jgi:hypothetical protein
LSDTTQRDSRASAPVSAEQREIFLAQERHPDSPQFNIAHYFDIAARIDTAVAERALHLVSQEADTLRARFTWTQEYGLALHIDYWLRHLHNRPRPVSLRSEIDRCDSIAAVGGVLQHSACLPTSVTQRIRSLKLEKNMDTPELFVAALAIYMHRLSGAEDLIVGMPLPGRLGALLRATPCMASNLVPLRISLHGGMRGADVVTRIAAEISGAFRHQRYRFEDLRRDTGALGSNDRLMGPIINLMRFHQEFRIGDQLATEYTVAIGPVEDVSIAIYDRAEDAQLRIDFNSTLANSEPAFWAQNWLKWG